MTRRNKNQNQKNGDDDINEGNDESQIITLLKTLVSQQSDNSKLMQAMVSNSNSNTSMKESIDVKYDSLSTDILNLHARMDALEKENKELKKCNVENEEKIRELEKLVHKSGDDVDEVEQYVRRSCLVINNLKSEHGKSDEEVFLNMCDDKFREKFTISSDMISKIHRVPRPQHSNVDRNSPNALIVKFNKDRHRDMVFKNKRVMKGSGITISELLTNKRSSLMKQCIDRIPGGTNRSIWTDNGRIYAKYSKDDYNSHSAQIKNIDDIEKFIQDINPLLPRPAASGP